MRADIRIKLEKELFNPNSPISHIRVDVRAKLLRKVMDEFVLELQEKIQKRVYQEDLDEFLKKQQKRFFRELKERLQKALEDELQSIRECLIRENPRWKNWLKHPEWKKFERAFIRKYEPQDLDKLSSIIEEVFSEESKTAKEVRDGFKTTFEELKRLRRSVLAHAHHLQGADGLPLIYHLDHAIKQLFKHTKALNNKNYKWWVGYLDRHSPQSEEAHHERDIARRLLMLIDSDLPGYSLGYEMLARLVRIITNNPSYDKRFVQSVLSEKRKERKANPLIQDAIHRMQTSLEKSAKMILFGEEK